MQPGALRWAGRSSRVTRATAWPCWAGRSLTDGYLQVAQAPAGVTALGDGAVTLTVSLGRHLVMWRQMTIGDPPSGRGIT